MTGGLTFGAWWPLGLLIIIPCLWWIKRRTLVDLSDRQLRISAFVRSAIVALLALALMEPVIYRPEAWVSTIYLLDVSQSAAPAAIQSAVQWIQRATQAGRAAHVRFVPFGANAAVLETIEQLKTVKVAAGPDVEAIDQSASDIEGAVSTALQNFAPHHLKRLVLLSDGNENAGHLMNIVSRLKDEGVRVYTVPLQARGLADAWVEAIEIPDQTAAGEPFPLDVQVYSQTATQAEVRLQSGNRTLGSRDVQLAQGLNHVAFETSVDDVGSITLQAEVNAPRDMFAANNRFRASLTVTGEPKILYVEGRAQSAGYLEAALRTDGFAVGSVAPERMPATAAELDPYDAVVLSDVARSSLTSQQMAALVTYVEELGGGFILAGGENTYGADDGYSGTDVEKVLPVTFEAKRPHQSVAMVVVLDKSGSMGAAEIGFAKEAAKAPLVLLDDSDQFGVAAFDSSFYWAVPLQPAAGRDRIVEAINTIVASGETNMFPALEAAYNALASNPSEVKHVILMTDGHTTMADFEGLVSKMARGRITVSTVALGAAADKALLDQIAVWGQGRTYYLTDASRVPQVFTDETQRTTGVTLREEPFMLVVAKNVQAFKGIDFKNAPPLLGYVATKSKEGAETLLESDDRNPILVRWQYGLGKTAAFTSDLKDRWAVNWLRWKGYSKFWSQLVRDTMRAGDDSQFDVRVTRDGDVARIAIGAIDKNGLFRNRVDAHARVVAPDQSVSDVPIHQVGPGSYEGEFDMTSKGGPYRVRVMADSAGLARTLDYSYPDEYHFYPPNNGLLRAVSTETGGEFQPEAAEIFDSHGETTAVPVPVWPYLAGLAAALYVADVFLRRVRVFVG